MEQWIDNTVAMLNKLEGLPAVALVFFFCLALGYVIRSIKSVDNSAIPLIVTFGGSLLMGLIANSRPTDTPLRVWVVRNILVGGIIGVASVLAHKFFLKKIEDWLAAKFDLGNTDFFTKDDQKDPP